MQVLFVRLLKKGVALALPFVITWITKRLTRKLLAR